LLAVGGIVAALAAVALGRPVLAVCAAACALIGFSLHAVAQIRADRLSTQFRAALAGGQPRERIFERVAGLLENACKITWAGLVSWHEHGLGGRIELSRGAGGAAEPALVSWLVREAESGSDLVATPGFELGSTGVYLALPLRRENSALVGFLVFQAPRSLPRHVEIALSRWLDSLGLAFADTPGSELSDVSSQAAAVLHARQRGSGPARSPAPAKVGSNPRMGD
jgi:hypothetical protein